jgi:uncharacterized protein
MEHLVEINNKYNILTLDGGGSKGIYTIGVLSEVEKMLGMPLHKKFNLIYGTSTGSIIAALLGLGYPISEIEELYYNTIPNVMSHLTPWGRTRALRDHLNRIFETKTFDDFTTGIGIVATSEQNQRPMIFKNSIEGAHGRKASFVPGFGCSIADAVKASCAAYPLFNKHTVSTSNHGSSLLYDGGFVANNPCLFAISDVVANPKLPNNCIRVLSVGTGQYPEKKRNWVERILSKMCSVELLTTTLAANTNTHEFLRTIMFSDISTVRIDEVYSEKRYATNLLEADVKKLRSMYKLGQESYGVHEAMILKLFGTN